MTKNNLTVLGQTIRVLGPDGRPAGQTYPKRAAGLVKKGRACYVNDFTIRLNMSDTAQISEVMKMDNMNHIEAAGRENEERRKVKLYFDARNWRFNKDCGQNVGNRSFMEGPDGVLAEAYMIGDWGHCWTEIVSETLLLPKYTDCSFTFWLNGGENDRGDEVCRFEILFDDDYEQRYTYNLNRNYIKPLKKLNGWELYEIPFHTQDNEYTQFRFAAQRAYMTVIAAKEPEAYAQFPDNPDPFETRRPQRHNLIFAVDGFPKDGWYSTWQLTAKYGNPKTQETPKANGVQDAENVDDNLAEIQKKLDDVKSACMDLKLFDFNDFADQIRRAINDSLPQGEMDGDELRQMIQDVTEEAVMDTMDSIEDALEEVNDQMEELKEALLEE